MLPVLSAQSVICTTPSRIPVTVEKTGYREGVVGVVDFLPRKYILNLGLATDSLRQVS